jgi:hypothetical protein
VQEAQSPFLQLYLGFTPRFAHAFLIGEPALKSFFFPLYANTVKSSVLEVFVKKEDGWFGTKASALEIAARVTRVNVKAVFIIAIRVMKREVPFV